MPKVGGKRKKARTHKETTENEETSTGQKIAKTFILKRGDIPNPLKNIIGDLREVMYPHTAMKMRESTKDKLKDYIQVGGGFGVTHMVVFSATTSSNYLRFIKLPEGPTLTFKILSYSSHKDILSTQKKPRVFGRTLAAPLLILNGFNNINPDNQAENAPAPHHYNLVNLMVQNMFPPLDLAKAKIHNSKKAVLFNLNQESDTIDFRYYGIKVHQAGINKNIKQILEAKKVPNLKNFKDISEYILRENDYMSENDMEDELEDKSKDEKKPDKMTVKLYEIGPRMTLKLIKIEEGMMRGNVVYHRLVHKTQEEIENNRRKIKEKAKQKELARQKQQEVVDAKTAKKQKKDEEKRKKAFLEDKEAKEEKGDEEEGYNKESEVRNAEEEEEKGRTVKKAFDLSKGRATFASDEEEEEGGDEEEEVEEDAGEYDEEDEEAGEDEEDDEIGAEFPDEEDEEDEDDEDEDM